MKTITVTLIIGLLIGFCVGIYVERMPPNPLDEKHRLSEIVRGGNSQQIMHELDRMNSEHILGMNMHYWSAFSSENISGAKCVEIIEEKYKKQRYSLLRAKLVSILGANGTPGATALLCELVENEYNSDILANIAVSLERSHPTKNSLSMLKSMKGNTRAAEVVYGKAICPEDGSTATVEDYAKSSYSTIRTALKLNISDPEFEW